MLRYTTLREDVQAICRLNCRLVSKRYGCRPLYEFPQCRNYARRCENAERLLKVVTTIPVHPGLSDMEIDYVVDVINAYRN